MPPPPPPWEPLQPATAAMLPVAPLFKCGVVVWWRTSSLLYRLGMRSGVRRRFAPLPGARILSTRLARSRQLSDAWCQSCGSMSRVVSMRLCTVCLRLQKKPRTVEPGLLPLFQESGDGRETITTAYLPLEANYSTHMPNEKPWPLGGTGASELALMDRPGWGWAGSDLSDCRFKRALKPIVPLAAAGSSRGAARARLPCMKRRAAPFFGVMNALAKVGVELGENGSILPRPEGGSPRSPIAVPFSAPRYPPGGCVFPNHQRK